MRAPTPNEVNALRNLFCELQMTSAGHYAFTATRDDPYGIYSAQAVLEARDLRDKLNEFLAAMGAPLAIESEDDDDREAERAKAYADSPLERVE